MGAMSFLEHLDELRKRIVNSAIAVGIGVIAAFAFHQRVYDFVFEPTRRVLPDGTRLMYTEPGEAFSLHIQIALIAGVVVAAPFIMYQVWRFIAPGLYANEKKFAVPFVLFSTIGFILGALFNHYVAFPFMMTFFASFNAEDLVFMPKIGPVFSLYAKFLIALGLIFQMPTVVFFLAKMKLVTARFLAKNFKYAVLIIFILAAVITPSGDPGTQAVFAAPMIGLYLISIVIAWIVGPKRLKASDQKND
ncbi:MAG: twin arginine-targeting protein translocase TatC [Acidobacteria bacterium RIFCSPLOWO2_12_FULL_65_11]|nr:MAG: twin arginine-targeting protein translocase TatC [Acidobacteria bacterium RIFCSPLOWO2_02_FULL_64_15]OFW29986.1 MAG: twin arginine-targeting protein translocase TatC [Acidobacteria bacterium RIFCSPLOWO2_12_FULL_65_11]